MRPRAMTRTRGTGRIFQPTWKDPRTGARRPSANLAIRYYDRRQHRHVTEDDEEEEAPVALAEEKP